MSKAQQARATKQSGPSSDNQPDDAIVAASNHYTNLYTEMYKCTQVQTTTRHCIHTKINLYYQAVKTIFVAEIETIKK